MGGPGSYTVPCFSRSIIPEGPLSSNPAGAITDDVETTNTKLEHLAMNSLKLQTKKLFKKRYGGGGCDHP